MQPLSTENTPLNHMDQFETVEMWKALRDAHRYLAEFKGLCLSLPNPSILIDTLSLQEAKDSSEIENIITTHDEIYSAQNSSDASISIAAKEVQHYASALKLGFSDVQETGLIRLDTILKIQAELEGNDAGLRKVPGTVLRNEFTGETIYEPPQSKIEVEQLMANVVDFIHQEDELDPLLRMAITHHQFESIHPFYDGNGRTGRILNILLLIREGLLDYPLLYLSRYINRNKQDYYRLLQTARTENQWSEWAIYIIRGVSETAKNQILFISAFRDLIKEHKSNIRERLPKIYSQDLLNTIFRFPYTKIEFLENELSVSRPTATKYLELLHQHNILDKQKIGRTNFYINRKLFNLLSQS